MTSLFDSLPFHNRSRPSGLKSSLKRVQLRIYLVLKLADYLFARILAGFGGDATINFTCAPPLFLLSSAAAMNAMISMVSSGFTGAAPVWKNFMMAATSGS